jgi:hypothetical protein
MKITPVKSSTLATVGYDEGGKLLQLEFCSRAVYQYFGVPSSVHEALLEAASKGGCFNRTIRGRYRFLRVGPAHPVGGLPGTVPNPIREGAAWPAQ